VKIVPETRPISSARYQGHTFGDLDGDGDNIKTTLFTVLTSVTLENIVTLIMLQVEL
jgi:hypothetical protein